MADERFYQSLLEISRRMAETRELAPLLQYAVRVALELLNAERGYLVLLKGDKLEFAVKLERKGEEFITASEEISNSIFYRVIETHKPIVTVDAIADPEFEKAESVRGLGLRSVMCAPLISRGNVIGALYLENRSYANIFIERDLEPLSFFTNQAAVSIENAILNDQLEERVRQRTQELQRTLEQLEKSWGEAVEANRLKTMLLGNVAHDIRSPISLAYSAIQTIIEGTFGNVSPKQIEWLTRASESLQVAVHLTGDLFDITKAEMNALEITPQPTALLPFLEHVYKLGSHIEWVGDVRLTHRLPTELPTLNLDPVRIQQVLLNLLTNAQKFTTQGEVLLYAELREDSVLIGVRDKGRGVPKEQQRAIFERFYQAEQGLETRRNGSGLGLAICKELVERHGGTIWVESEAGAGADFKFTLPIK
jgi:signal transduction histidine kinase